jgi:hypothetical protein
MALADQILKSERKLLNKLEDYFNLKYNERNPESHGLSHHRRVWAYAKELLHQTYRGKEKYDPKLISKLLIACYLHDIGMAIDPGEKHGHHSRLLCMEFLLQQNLNPEEYHDVLQAIGNHDNKDYSGRFKNNGLRAILSVADDLDAFGCTGIWRYAEIYRLRGISFQQIGKEVPENARKRFENFVALFSLYPELLEIHIHRYNYLNDFFKAYNDQITGYMFGSDKPSGYCGVLEILQEITIGAPFFYAIHDDPRYNGDQTIYDFLIMLQKELDISF